MHSYTDTQKISVCISYEKIYKTPLSTIILIIYINTTMSNFFKKLHLYSVVIKRRPIIFVLILMNILLNK